jgi:hypothetical protein
MPRLAPRDVTILQDIEHQLRPLMASEGVVILARAMARLVNKDLRQSHALTEQFKAAFLAENEYLTQQRTRAQSERANRGGIP